MSGQECVVPERDKKDTKRWTIRELNPGPLPRHVLRENHTTRPIARIEYNTVIVYQTMKLKIKRNEKRFILSKVPNVLDVAMVGFARPSRQVPYLIRQNLAPM